MKLRNDGQEEIDDDLFTLARGPDFGVKKYTSCIVNGVCFNTVDRDSNKKTQNSGVMAQASHNNELIDFFRTLKEIVQLEYPDDDRSVVLFKCDWYKLDGKKTELQYDGFCKSINIQVYGTRMIVSFWPLRLGKSFIYQTPSWEKWQIVQTFDHRHLFNVREIESAHYNAPAYQEDEGCEKDGTREPVSSTTTDKPLNRDDEQGLIFEAADIARLMKDRDEEAQVSGGEEEEDDTLLEYCSDEEGGAAMEVDSDDE
jgi:hypothetical protein